MKKSFIIFIILTVLIINACASDLTEEAADVIFIMEEPAITAGDFEILPEFEEESTITANEVESETLPETEQEPAITANETETLPEIEEEYVDNNTSDTSQPSQTSEFVQPHEKETERETEIAKTTVPEFPPISTEPVPPSESTPTSETAPPSDFSIEWLIQNMTLKQKVGQMFFHAFRQDNNGKHITKINQNIIDIINNYNIGGVILFSENIQSAQQVTDYINALQTASSLPLFISIDEEGGRVLRTKSLNVPRIEPALGIGSTGDPQNAYNAAQTIAKYLSPLGFNVNFAPVADVFTNPSNTVIGDRAFAKDASEAAEMVKYFTRGLLDNNILPTLKHFPGHGDTLADSHFGSAATNKTLAELSECEFIPFQAGIKAGAPFVMTGHISTPNITGNNEPALFSSYLLRDILRNTLGFDGIIITDALNMGAVIKYYNPAQTAVKAVLAGVDILLMPANLEQAYNGVIQAVESGEITESRIDESVRRILTVKYESGIIK